METLGTTITSLFAMLVTLGILVTIHEYGHFIIARWCGVKVERFSIGFGKPLLRWRGKAAQGQDEGTEYVISALPLGGYVKMLGEQEEVSDPVLRRQSFSHKPLIQRTAIVAAGPLANFILAVIIYCGIFFAGVNGLAPVVGAVDAAGTASQTELRNGDEILAVDGKNTSTWQDVHIAMLERLGESGELVLLVRNAESSLTRTVELPISNWHSDTDQPDLLGSLGITPYHMFIEPRLLKVLDGPASTAGLQAGDLILAADGEVIADWNMFLAVIKENAAQTISLDFERDGLTLNTLVTPGVRVDDSGNPELDQAGRQQGYIGAYVVVPQLPVWMSRKVEYSLWQSIPAAVNETASNSLFVLDSIKKMLMGHISVKNLSGPITIAQVAGETASSGLSYYARFLALLSISLGVLNLLPIPVLDGGHLFYYAIEAVIRRPVPRRIQELGLQLGMMVVACIMLLALFNDVNRLF